MDDGLVVWLVWLVGFVFEFIFFACLLFFWGLCGRVKQFGLSGEGSET